ncbi:WD40 repeat-like protein [Yamadazyma tenuis ATCC 10573]|uniref:WD40 repeat-like protein n=1 Tax=Candida tenuis (strain ATCC 10573 / BCRC 21748 / CBS 615 / JCM 9827 / NBRC 10315 / NRRL Y-1498 / VKM Y-70) TaxID=590646 RepID=G3B751_CANTC|nr:WD40 repeat-like protein [Yamadazyma tenuis ATCC 10573]EGV63101.1 WD40 repeat-like protein [Yamadazyma tenuis ATCC 10573]
MVESVHNKSIDMEMRSDDDFRLQTPTPRENSTPEVELQMNAKLDDLYIEKHQIVDPDNSSINAVKISPDGKTLAYCTSSGVIRVYNLDGFSPMVELSGHTKGVSDIDYSPINSDILASASDDLTIRIWSISKNKCLKILKKHTYHVTSVNFTQKGNILISGSADETITIWDLSSGKSLKTLAAHSDAISSISLTPDNTIIASGSYDGLMRLFDCETGQCLKTLVYNTSSHGTATASTSDVVNPPISCVEFSPNGKFILSSSLDGVIRLWDYMDNKVMKTFGGEDGNPVCEKFGCPAKFVTTTLDPLVVSGSDAGILMFWNVHSKNIVCNQINMEAPILGIDMYQGGKVLAVCSKKGELKFFEINEKYVKS